jgi:vanillate O-demethylase ferredoxin subunit
MKQLKVLVHAIRVLSSDIRAFDLHPIAGDKLPPFTAGSHIEVHMDDQLARSYSLANDPDTTDHYEIAVHRGGVSKGGAIFMHEKVKAGDLLKVSEPRNNFALDETAEHTVLIAGGIGITPLRSMISRMRALGMGWTLFYCGRDRQSMAYLEEFEVWRDKGKDVRLHIDSES